MNTQTTLITGASSGIGLHLAREFASHGHPLVIVAPVEAELRQIAADLTTNHGVTVRCIAKDLEKPEAAQEIYDELHRDGVEVDVLVAGGSDAPARGKGIRPSLRNGLSRSAGRRG